MKRYTRKFDEIYPTTRFEPTFKNWEIPQVISKESTPVLTTKDGQKLKIDSIYIGFDKPNPTTNIICYDEHSKKIIMEIKDFKKKYFE